MNLIAIDCSTPEASLAIWANGVLFERIEATQKNHAMVILPLIDALLQAAHIQMAEVEGIVFGCGPGSFTGLRIACSLAKGLAFAHDLPLYPVGSLFNMAYGARMEKAYANAALLSVMDAHMKEVYWCYTDNKTVAQTAYVTPVSAIKLPDDAPSLRLLHANLPQTILDALQAFMGHRIQETSLVFPCAATMIQMVLQGLIAPVNARDATPVYIRNKVTHG